MALDLPAAEPWIALATADLAMVDLALGSHSPTSDLLGLACFHAQQAAEKSVKAVLAAHHLPIPYTHALTVLGRRAQEVAAMDEPVQSALDDLTDFGVGPRYPLSGRTTTVEVAQRARGDAELICNWVRTVLALTG